MTNVRFIIVLRHQLMQHHLKNLPVSNFFDKLRKDRLGQKLFSLLGVVLKILVLKFFDATRSATFRRTIIGPMTFGRMTSSCDERRVGTLLPDFGL